MASADCYYDSLVIEMIEDDEEEIGENSCGNCIHFVWGGRYTMNINFCSNLGKEWYEALKICQYRLHANHPKDLRPTGYRAFWKNIFKNGQVT